MPFYWCHRCQRTVETSDLRCSQCNDEFIEEIPNHSQPTFQGSSHEQEEQGQPRPSGSFLFNNLGGHMNIVVSNSGDGDSPNQFPLPALLQHLIGYGEGRVSPQSQRRTHTAHIQFGRIPPFSNPSAQSSNASQDPQNQNSEQNPTQDIFGGLIGQLLSNLTANLPNGQNVQYNFTGPDGNNIRGNLGNYAFGEQNFDEIITNLLNNFEHSQGLQKQEAQRVPITNVTQKQVDNGAQCTTCMDTFNLDEEVAQLNCNHIFHKLCITPWLERQKTCPICRQEVDPSSWPGAPEPRVITDVDELD